VAIALLYFVPAHDANRYATGIGEQRTVALADGSVVTLNVATELDVEFTPQWRDIHLRSGQALFTVAHDSSRPFRVHVDETIVKAIGTKFDVRRAGGGTLVYVVEGRVRIEPPELAALDDPSMRTPRLAAFDLTPGEGTTIRQDGHVDPTARINLKAMSAWQSRRLVFEERSLGDIATEFGSYVRAPKLIVEGAELRARLYTGSFDADRLDSFIDYLQRDASVEILRDGDRVIVRPAADAGDEPPR
jgi:transmembrane sensor